MKRLIPIIIFCIMIQPLFIQCNMLPPEDRILDAYIHHTSLFLDESEKISISKYLDFNVHPETRPYHEIYFQIEVRTLYNSSHTYQSFIQYGNFSIKFTKHFSMIYISFLNETTYRFLFLNQFIFYGPPEQHNFTSPAIKNNLYFTIHNNESFTSDYDVIMYLKKTYKSNYEPTKHLPSWAGLIIGLGFFGASVSTYYGIKKLIVIYNDLPKDVAEALNEQMKNEQSPNNIESK